MAIGPLRNYSAVIPAALMIFAHFSRSCAIRSRTTARSSLFLHRSPHGRLRREPRAAHAHPAARILPQLLGRMQVAERARDSVEVVGREELGDVRVVERLLLDRRQD